MEPGSSQSGLGGGIAGLFVAPVLFVAILQFATVTFGNIGTPLPNAQYLSTGEAAFYVIASIVLGIFLIAYFILQPRIKPVSRLLVLTVAFLLLAGFLLVDAFVIVVSG